MKKIGIVLLLSVFLFGHLHPVFADDSRQKNNNITLAHLKDYLMKTFKISDQEATTVEKDILSKTNQLRQKGWSKKTVEMVFLRKTKKEKTLKEYQSLLSSRFQNDLLFGSSDFQEMWLSQMNQANTQEMKKLLSIAMKTIGMPDDLSGKQTETQQLLTHFSPSLAPDDPFWKDISKSVQKAFPRQSLLAKGTLNQQVHQFRYVISAQQAQWIRHHIKKSGETDAQALARYLKNMDEMNTFLEEQGIDKSDYYFDYSYGESSRLHNKIALSTKNASHYIKIYPDGKLRTNYKIVLHFYSEFILDNEGQFVNELDPEHQTENGIINGASFNYADRNNSRHRELDVFPVSHHDPTFRIKAYRKYPYPFKAPNGLFENTMSQRWLYSYYNAEGFYSQSDNSLFNRVKAEVLKFKKLVEKESK